ncbi:unnamed protein product [Darwinula stevensoni]|uniref:RING-type domain-containing protein n=1 Tax=Darwinula stevensoni TaxID=69355 RepID=A0A7R9ABJ2_9CRUS|nr:unnamed protein product [Darwinula stevensoni]CAG0899294.1 unnamed protein product [Darwinula stevensoni]
MEAPLSPSLYFNSLNIEDTLPSFFGPQLLNSITSLTSTLNQDPDEKPQLGLQDVNNCIFLDYTKLISPLTFEGSPKFFPKFPPPYPLYDKTPRDVASLIQKREYGEFHSYKDAEKNLEMAIKSLPSRRGSSDDEGGGIAEGGGGENGGIGVTCNICLHNLVNTVLIRCGHLGLCYACALEQWVGPGQGLCPFCRAPISLIQKITPL